MKMKKALLAFALAAPAIARQVRLTIGTSRPKSGVSRRTTGARSQDENWLFGVALGREINQYFNLELNTEADRLRDRNRPGNLYTYSTTLDALAILNRDGVVAPYLRLGVGALRNTPTGAP